MREEGKKCYTGDNKHLLEERPSIIGKTFSLHIVISSYSESSHKATGFFWFFMATKNKKCPYGRAIP